MSSQPDQDTDRSVLSWESVLDASDTETTPDSNAAASAAPAPPPASTPDDIDLTIAPLSLDALSLDPLPSIGDQSAPRTPAALDNTDVLGDIHLELPPLDLDDSAVPAPPSAPASPTASVAPATPVTPVPAPVADVIDLTIAPLDIPDLTPSGQVPSVAPQAPLPAAAPEQPAAVAPQPTPTAPESAPAAPPVVAPDVVQDTPGPSASVAGLPADAVPHDHSPTTVISATAATPAPVAAAVPPMVAAIPSPQLPGYQTNQSKPSLAPQVARASTEPAQVSRRDRKHQNQLKKHQQKAALKKAKAATARSGAGGVALFFTLLVLVGLIAGAIIFGRPYLFPDEWDEAARPYGEAVETARGAEFSEPVTVQRRAADVFATSMTAHVLGPWESELPTWRSLGLISGAVDAPLLQELAEDWTAAYYAPATGEIIANDAAGPGLLDAAIAEAMAAAALDQETGWSSSIDDALLDSPALTRAVVTASSSAAAAATTFGAADHTIRDIAVSTFLPPVLEYRANAPLAFAEFSTNDPTQRSADFEALRVASELQLSSAPEVVAGDTIVSTQQMTDRTYWYLVFASYTDAASAYAASNDLVQASLATADSAGRHCTYATFSGTDVDGTTRVSNVLQQWATNAPVEMTASVSTLATGTMQLRTCDPGVSFDNRARFGVSREIARLRSVELAAVAAIPVVEGATADRAAAIAEVRTSQVGLPLTELTFEASLLESAQQARTLVAGAPVEPAE